MVVPIIPNRSALAGSKVDMARTAPIPRIEQIRPLEARARGKNIKVARPSPSLIPGASAEIEAAASVDAIAIVAINEPT